MFVQILSNLMRLDSANILLLNASQGLKSILFQFSGILFCLYYINCLFIDVICVQIIEIIKIMNTINSSLSGAQRKNRKQLNNFKSIINDYENSLNSKVDDLVNHIINYSKKTQDPLFLPQIKQPKSATLRSKSQSKTFNLNRRQNARTYQRDKSISNSSFSFMSQISQNMEQKINYLKKSAAQSLMKQHISIIPQGRPLGNKKFVKPKFVKKQPDIIPKQLRLDPFAQKNIIKAQDLDKGIMNLLQKGKIGKDVDIITAFQKGGDVLNAKQAIFHHGQQRLTRNQPIKNNRRQAIPLQSYSNMINRTNQIQYETNSWAITMPDHELDIKYDSKRMIENTNREQQKLNLQQILYIQFLHYRPVQNIQFKKWKIINQQAGSEINSILSKLGKLLQKYSLQIVYTNSSKILQLSTLIRRVKQSQLIECIISFKGRYRIPLKQIANIKQKKQQAARRIQSLIRKYRSRKRFLLYLQKKKVQKTICNWLYNLKIRKDFSKKLNQYKQSSSSKFQKIQQNFRLSFKQIQQNKHFQIHISNKSLQGKSRYRQIQNTQITRIFNFQNSNTHIIIILSQSLNEETKNYYYKIMELQQIPNYKQRVNFISVKNHPQFAGKKLSCSQRFYYDSNIIRQVKRKIGSHPAYFRISYPTPSDIHMASYLDIPILTGYLPTLLQIQQRSQSIEHFGLPQLKCFRVKKNQFTLLTLSSALVTFCENNKRYKNYVVKINGCYESKGIGLLTYPFDSLPAIYSNTALIVNAQNLAPSQFYRKLCKHGGIIQVFEQSLSSIVLVGKIDSQLNSQLLGTYDKISYGFVNVGYFFPQMTIANNQILPIFNSISQKLKQIGHFGDFQVSLFVDQKYQVYLDKIQFYQTQIGSSLFYFKFLCEGTLNSKGQYISKIIQTYQTQDNKEQELVTLQPRNYCYIPYILHFGLSQKQVGSFFQLCRMGGISFDLQNKFGSTFILLGSLRNSMGMITTARDRETCKKLMLKSLQFIIKQNSHNNSHDFIEQKQKRMKERQNIIALKQRLEDM